MEGDGNIKLVTLVGGGGGRGDVCGTAAVEMAGLVGVTEGGEVCR